MKVYTVGGAVRDGLLGLPVQDRDHVVVGATPEAMERLGYRPVGRDFPVFLHPQTHEEYALARTERKVGRGYKGFTVHADPAVTLEEDLARRDLTINAMARADDGTLIDPHGGERDLRAGVLRHVGPAFVEDPVRILRLARFAARFDFRVAPETLALMRSMVAGGETGALVPERVWQELSRGLMEHAPQRMFRVLHACGLAQQWLPEVAMAWQGDAEGAVPQALAPADATTREVEAALAQAAALAHPLPVRFALLAFALRAGGDRETAARDLAARLRADNDSRDALVLAARYGATALAIGPQGTAEQALALIEASDALRRPGRLGGLLAACACLHHARCSAGDTATGWMMRMLAAAAGIDAGAIAAAAAAAGTPTQIPVRLRAARLAAMAAAGKN